MLAATSITFFFVADVKCGLYEINKKTTEQMLRMDRQTESGPNNVPRVTTDNTS